MAQNNVKVRPGLIYEVIRDGLNGWKILVISVDGPHFLFYNTKDKSMHENLGDKALVEKYIKQGRLRVIYEPK